MKLISLLLCFSPLLGAFESPTQKYLEIHPIEEIKYNIRLDGATLIYKELFDKIIPKEKEGFIGYHGDSLEFRIYQDVIKTVLQEIVSLDIPKDFHFLAIPCFYEQKIRELREIPNFFTPEKDRSACIKKQLFPLNCSLYANHNQIGYNSVVPFTLNRSTVDLKQDLEAFFSIIGIDPLLVEEAFAIGKSQLKDDRGILLQLFDTSTDPYAFANHHCYGAYPSGYPFANCSLSDYYERGAEHFPTEIRLLLTDSHTLNPHSPLTILRYDKLQTSVVATYEKTLKTLFKGAAYDPLRVDLYRQTLIETWR